MEVNFYLKMAFKGLMRNKFNSFVVILGLAVAFTCLLFTLSWFKYELSYDSFYKDSDRVFQLNTHFRSSGMVWRTTPFPLSEELNTFSEVDKISVLQFDSQDLAVEDGTTLSVNVLKTDTGFYGIFPQSFLIGNANAITSADIVLTKDFVRRHWGTADVIGKSIGNYIIKGIVETPPSNTIFPFDALVLRPENERRSGDWSNYLFLTFVRLHDKAEGARLSEKLERVNLRPNNEEVYFQVVPLYLSKHMIDGQSFIQAFGSFIVIVVALLLLLLSALFNFIMLATAGYLSKLKTYAIHKTMGASGWQIVKSIYAEIFLSLVLVFIISAYMVELFRGPVSFYLDIVLDARFLFGEFVKYMTICSVFVFVSALYIALYIRSLALKKMLIGGTEQGAKGKLSIWMIGVQLAVTIILTFFIAGTAAQFSFMTKDGLGFTVDNIGRIDLESDALKQNIIPFINDLKANKAIKDVIWSDYDLFRSKGAYSSRGGANEFLLLPDFDSDDKREVFFYPMKADVLSFFNIALVQGRYFTDDGESGMTEVVVTEQLVNEFGVKDIVDEIKAFDESPVKVVGVVKDFHCNPMTERVQPAVLINSVIARRWGGSGVPSICYFKFSPDQKQEAFDAVREAYIKYSGDYVPDIRLFKDYIQQFYKMEKRMLIIFGVITLVSVFISLIGLFALILFKLYHRRKEIALRKIQGASAWQIMFLLLKEYVLLMLVASIVAIPVVYFSLDYWLSQYQYRAEIHVLSAIGILLLIAALVFLTIIGQVIKTVKINPVKVIKENG